MFHTLIPLCNKSVLSRILGKKITSVDLRILKKNYGSYFYILLILIFSGNIQVCD